MYIKEFENIEIILKSIRNWKNKLGYKPIKGIPILVHWTLLKTTRFRTLFIKVKCDDCGDIFERRIRDLNVNNNVHYCKKCQNKGERNGQFGISMPEKTKNALKKSMEINGNPFTWDSVKKILKEKQEETIKKYSKKNTGKKRTEETKKKMSESIKLAYKNGKINHGNGYSNIKIETYNGIQYQGTYELKFLKYVENFNKLQLIQRGPTINYFINGKEHTYFVDYMIKDSNILFEIKSSYYWEKAKDVNIAKKETAEKLFEYHLIIDNEFESIKYLFES